VPTLKNLTDPKQIIYDVPQGLWEKNLKRSYQNQNQLMERNIKDQGRN
jgi:hypothetical protein